MTTRKPGIGKSTFNFYLLYLLRLEGMTLICNFTDVERRTSPRRTTYSSKPKTWKIAAVGFSATQTWARLESPSPLPPSSQCPRSLAGQTSEWNTWNLLQMESAEVKSSPIRLKGSQYLGRLGHHRYEWGRYLNKEHCPPGMHLCLRPWYRGLKVM